MEPAVDSDEENTIRYAGYTAVMLAPGARVIDTVGYAQLGEEDNDIQPPSDQAAPVQLNGIHPNGNHVRDSLAFDDEEQDEIPSTKPPPPPSSSSAPQVVVQTSAPRPLLSASEPMEASRVSDVLEAMAGIRLVAPPPAWLMSNDWQTPLRAHVPHLKAAATAPTTTTTDSTSTPPSSSAASSTTATTATTSISPSSSTPLPPSHPSKE